MTPTLDGLLKRVCASGQLGSPPRKLTPAEIWDQRVSFVFGQLMDCAPHITREEVEARAVEMYGPRPS